MVIYGCNRASLIFAGLSGIQGLSIVSNPESPIVFLKLTKSTGSMKADLQILEDIAERVSNTNFRQLFP
ncbi:hypothetical protein J0J37_22485, partial [Vibrio vulnificus]|uniref:hypothetical protein n=1 Tax=Vibrio vulnificus TaxID=672 RepID=UPI0019D4B5BA